MQGGCIGHKAAGGTRAVQWDVEDRMGCRVIALT